MTAARIAQALFGAFGLEAPPEMVGRVNRALERVAEQDAAVAALSFPDWDPRVDPRSADERLRSRAALTAIACRHRRWAGCPFDPRRLVAGGTLTMMTRR